MMWRGTPAAKRTGGLFGVALFASGSLDASSSTVPAQPAPRPWPPISRISAPRRSSTSTSLTRRAWASLAIRSLTTRGWFGWCGWEMARKDHARALGGPMQEIATAPAVVDGCQVEQPLTEGDRILHGQVRAAVVVAAPRIALAQQPQLFEQFAGGPPRLHDIPI